jgi:hypothetical protein
VSLANEVNGAFRKAGGVASDFQGGCAMIYFCFPCFLCCLCYGTDRFMGVRLGYGTDTKAKAYAVRFTISEQTKEQTNKQTNRDSLNNIFRNQEL